MFTDRFPGGFVKGVIGSGLISRKVKWGFLFWHSPCPGRCICSRAEVLSPSTVSHKTGLSCVDIFASTAVSQFADGRLLCAAIMVMS